MLLVEHSTKNTFSFADDYDDDGDDNNGARTRLRQDDRLCRRGNRVHKGFLVAEHCHSMEYSLVIDSDWQQSFPRHMLNGFPVVILIVGKSSTADDLLHPQRHRRL